MFKKVLVLGISLGLFLFLFNIRINASEVLYDDIYLEKDLECDEIETYFGDEVVSGRVDVQKCGKYQVTYFNHNNLTYHETVFHVLNKYAYESGYNYLEEESSLHYTNEATSSVRKVIEQGEYKIIAYVFLYPNKQNSLANQKAAFCIFKGNEQVKSYTYSSYSIVKDLKFTKAGFMILVDYEDNGKIHTVLEEYSLQGENLRMYLIKGNQYDRGIGFYQLGEELYLVLNTSSSTITFPSLYPNTQSVVIVKMKYVTFEVEKYLSFGNDISNEVKSVLFSDNATYILFKPVGVGEFLRSGTQSYFICKINQDLEIEAKDEITKTDSFFGMFYIDGKIAVCYNLVGLTNTLFINDYDLDLNLVNSRDCACPNEDYYIDKIVGETNKMGNFVAVVLGKSKEDFSPALLGYIYMQNDHFEYEEWFSESLKIVNVVKEGSTITLLGASGLDLKKINYYYIRKENDSLYLNNERIQMQTIYNTYSENKLYGTNQKCEYLVAGDSCFIDGGSYFCPLETSVRSGETYESGISIYANGIAYLDDKLVTEDEIVIEKGKHLLAVYGTSGNVSYIEFTIDDIAKKATDLQDEEITYNLSLETKPLTSPNKIKVDDYETASLSTTSSSVPEALIVASIIALASLLIPFKGKRGRK